MKAFMKIIGNLVLISCMLFSLSSNGMQSNKKELVIGGLSCITGIAGVLTIAHQVYTKNYDSYRIVASAALLGTSLTSAMYLVLNKNRINNRKKAARCKIDLSLLDFGSYEGVYERSSRCSERSFLVNYKKDDIDQIFDMSRGDSLYIRKGSQTTWYDISTLKGSFVWLKYHDKWMLVEKNTGKIVPEKREIDPEEFK